MKISVRTPQKLYLNEEVVSLKISLDGEELNIEENHADLERVFNEATFQTKEQYILQEGLLKIYKEEIHLLAEKVFWSKNS